MLLLFALSMLLLLPGGVSCDECELGSVLLLPDASAILSLLSLSFSWRLSLVCLRDFWPSLGKDPPKHKADFPTIWTLSSDAGEDSPVDLA